MNATTIETPDIRAAARMAQAVMDSGTRVGRLLGEPGTGKTRATHYLVASRDDAVRVCCAHGISARAMMLRLAEALGLDEPRGSLGALLDLVAAHAEKRLILIDEANHLRWQQLELLRYLPDEAGAGLILVGTELLHRTFVRGKNQVFLAQLARRIGTKQITLGRMDAKQTAAYVLAPRFGPVDQATAREFHTHAKGYWGESDELAAGCRRVMDVNQIAKLTEAVIQAAVGWLAEGRRAA